MRKNILTFLFFCAAALALSTSANGQTLTQVSGTITDPNGLPYSNATISIQLSGGGSTPQTTPCASSPCNVVNPNPIQTDAAGKFSIALWANGSITPASTQWSFLVQEPGVAPPWGLGPKSFTLTTTISGATQSLSSAMDALAPALTPAFSGSSTPCTTAAGAIQYNQASAFGCSANLTYNQTTGVFQYLSNGVFTDTQNNLNVTATVGSGCPQAIGGNNTIAITGAICVPSSGVTNAFNVGVAGFATNSNSSSLCALAPGKCEGIGVFANSVSNAAGAFAWGMSATVQSTVGDPTTIIGYELNPAPANTGDSSLGFLYSPFGSAQPSLQTAFEVSQNGGTDVATVGFICDRGSVNVGNQICIDTGIASTGPSNGNATQFDANDGAQNVETFQRFLQDHLFAFSSSLAALPSSTEPSGFGIGLTATTMLSPHELVKIDSAHAASIVACTTTDTSCSGFIEETTTYLCAGGGPDCPILASSGQLALGILGTGSCAIDNPSGTRQFVTIDTTTNGDIKCVTSQPSAGAYIGLSLSAQSSIGGTVQVLTKFQ